MTVKVNVDKCDTGAYCKANNDWITPESATVNSKLKCNGIPTPTPTPTNVVPGDYCTADKDCYGNDKGAKCTANACTPTIKETESCADKDGNADHKLCPVGLYCKADKTCAKTIAAGQKCSTADLCSFGLACYKATPEATDTTCGKLFSLDYDGVADLAAVHPSAWTGPAFFCKSYYTWTSADAPPKTYCRNPPKSDDTTEAALMRDESGKDCTYKTWDGAGVTADKPTATKDTSKCGFNKDGSAYCNKRIGDTWYQSEVVQKLTTLDLTKLSCHVDTGLASCKAFIDQGADWIKAFAKRSAELGDGSWARVANNDGCVAKSITNSYWGDSSPDSAFSYSVVSTLVMLISLASMVVLF